MAPLATFAESFTEWRSVPWSELAFNRGETAILAAFLALALAIVTLIVVLAVRRGRVAPGRVALPAMLVTFRRSGLRAVRHLPFALFLVGLPLFLLALADPFTRLTREQMSYPGRRLALFVDASGSMTQSFKTTKLGAKDTVTFFSAVSAAERFIRMRMDSRYRDLIALIEFGDEAYVVTPFTTDYENILLSISLINTWDEWAQFKAPGTVIINALNVAVSLYKSFDFLKANGNAMIIFSDGEDTQVRLEGRSLDDILSDAHRYKIPVYMLRMEADKALGDVLPDKIWKAAIEKTGGRFYPVANEAAIFQAIEDIDRLATGRIEVTRYPVDRPRFQPFAAAALACWLGALALRLAVPAFSRFP